MVQPYMDCIGIVWIWDLYIPYFSKSDKIVQYKYCFLAVDGKGIYNENGNDKEAALSLLERLLAIREGKADQQGVEDEDNDLAGEYDFK